MKTSALTIVMYHYVKDMRLAENAGLKALDLAQFKGQLDYLQRHYAIVSMKEVINSVYGEDALPPNACLLSFDDGYIDHYANVFPLLMARGLTGAFFPPSKAIENRMILDVNKIHYILALVNDHDRLVTLLMEYVDRFREEYGLQANEQYMNELYKENRFDPPNTAFIKRMLQFVLPEEVRKQIADALFKRFVCKDEKQFADTIYLNCDHLREMREAGMHVGAHGYRHYWLGHLSPDEQNIEVDNSLHFLKRLGVSQAELTFCYPYGHFNDPLVDQLRRKGFKIGLTTKVAVADLNVDDALLLPRIDTVHLPFEATASKKTNFN